MMLFGMYTHSTCVPLLTISERSQSSTLPVHFLDKATWQSAALYSQPYVPHIIRTSYLYDAHIKIGYGYL